MDPLQGWGVDSLVLKHCFFFFPQYFLTVFSFKNVFTFGCTGSSWPLQGLFSRVGKPGLTGDEQSTAFSRRLLLLPSMALGPQVPYLEHTGFVVVGFELLRGTVGSSWIRDGTARLLLNPEESLGFLASGGEEFNPGPETKLDRSDLLCHKVLLKYKGDGESF